MLSQSALDKLNELTPEQRQVAIKILKDTLENNKSATFNELLETDYEEIPVDIDTFLTDRRYLGEFTNGGKNLTYRKWPEALREWFPNPLAPSPFVEIALTGAIGLGKSTNFDFAMTYFLYKMMCLKDPNAYYGQPGSTLWFCFFNNTLNSANSAAYGKFQSMLKSSPWFMERGSLTGIKNPEYVPNKDIRFMIGSTLQHTLGINIICACLPEGTQILTTNGVKDIKELVGTNEQYFSLNDNKEIITSKNAEVKKIDEVKELIEIELEDNTIIKCTPDHMFLLKNGNYKSAELLTDEDEIEDRKDYQFIEYWKQFGIKSEHNMKRYINFISKIEAKGKRNLETVEKHHIVPKSLFMNNNLIELTPKEHYIVHHILARALRGKMIYAFQLMSLKNHYKITARIYEEIRKALIKEMSENPIGYCKSEFWTEEKRRKLCEKRKGSGNAMYGKRKELSPHYGKIAVTKENKTIFIQKNELQSYLDRGYQKRIKESVRNNISKARTHYKYIYEDKEFYKINGQGGIREFLQNNGYPTISQNMIHKIYTNGNIKPCNGTDYRPLIGKIRRVDL